MSNFMTLVGKELRMLFVSPIAYVVLAVFYAVSGYFFHFIMRFYVEQAAMSQAFRPAPVDVPTMVAQSFFGVLSTILLFVLPMITMGMLAEERKRGTIELLFTSPITTAQLIMGKFSAGLIFVLVMFLPALINILIVIQFSSPKPPLPPLLIGLAGALLLAGAMLAVGLFISSLTENQIVAAALTFGVFIILWVLDASADPSSTIRNEVLRYLSVLNHYEDFTRGIFDTQHLVFYLSFIFLGLFLTSLSLDSVKWRK